MFMIFKSTALCLVSVVECGRVDTHHVESEVVGREREVVLRTHDDQLEVLTPLVVGRG